FQVSATTFPAPEVAYTVRGRFTPAQLPPVPPPEPEPVTEQQPSKYQLQVPLPARRMRTTVPPAMARPWASQAALLTRPRVTPSAAAVHLPPAAGSRASQA